jgi:hypothetical protein
VPEAKRFTNQFCSHLRQPLARQAKDTDIVMIPSGSLDDEAPIKPQAAFSPARVRAGHAPMTELPVYPEYAPQ